MLIAVISDSHNNYSAINEIKKRIKDIDVILYLGDGEGDLELITKDFNGKVYAVKGNCDFISKKPVELLVELNDKKIFMCHGHKYNVKQEYNTIYYKGIEVGADIVLFGHSHIGIIEESENIIVMNPGSISHSIVSTSYGLINLLDDGKISCSLEKI